ncbi:MAG: hypothetical protein P8X89_22040 [Reinekea sp.]
MDRFNWSYCNINHYYNQAYQEDSQHTSQPEIGQTSAAVMTSGPSWSYPASGQPYPNPNLPAQIPPSPTPDWECFLRTPQPMALEEIIPSQIRQEDGQHTIQPETGQTFVAESGAWGSHPAGNYPAPGQPQPYQDLNPPAQIPSWPWPDWGASQPIPLEEISQHDAPPESSNPQPSAPARRGRRPARELPPLKERFLAGLEAFGRGVQLKDCSSSLKFGEYILDDGSLTRKGLALHNRFTDAEKMRFDQSIIARQEAKVIRLADENAVNKRFLAGLDNYARGVKLASCSATIAFKSYVTDDGHLHKAGETVFKSLSPEDQERVNQALLCRSENYFKRAMTNAPVDERFLAGLDKYAQGVQLKDCSETIKFNDYVTDKGKLQRKGRNLRDNLSLEDQERLDQALLCRSDIYLSRAMANASVEERFLAGLDNYAQGVLLKKCSASLSFVEYVTDDGKLHSRGRSLRDSLSQEDQARVDQALTARGRLFSQRTSKYVNEFMNTLEPYANGLTLQECGAQSGLKRKAGSYLTPEGGLTHKGELLIENLQPGQLNKVFNAIEKRQRRMELNSQVPEPPSQWPEMPSSMPEMGGVDPTSMIDPIPMEAMWSTVWQLTGQAVPGTWGMPSESAEPPIPYYDRDAIGADFQHQYGPYGLIPQRAPDRLIGRGIVRDTLINILGEVYRVHDMGSFENPTNENPYGKKFMLIPRMRGG